MGSQKRNEIWNSLLDSEMNELYWSVEAQRYGVTDRILSMSVAILSSGTLLALFNSAPIIGRTAACIVTVVSIVHATFFHTGRLKQVTSLAARWKEMAIEYRLLWAEVCSESDIEQKAWKEFESISRREKQIDESAFSINERRLSKAFQQVHIARGLIYERAEQTSTTASTTNSTASIEPSA